MTQRSTDDQDIDLAWMEEELFSDNVSTAQPPGSLVTIRYVWDAVRRHVRLWAAIAVVGLLAGIAAPFVLPSPEVASVKLLLTHRDGDDPMRVMATDASLATSQTVAQRVIGVLQLQETPDELLDRYTATGLTDRVLDIRTSADSSAEAVVLASTIAEEYLAFRQEQIELQVVPLQEELAVAVDEADEARAALVASGGDPNDTALPSTGEARAYTRAVEERQFLEQQILDQEATAARMSTSGILDDATSIPQSRAMALLTSTATGLLAGLLVGIGFVVVRALVSDRLWRRNDIARALGTPVTLGVGRPPLWQRQPFPRALRKSQRINPEIRSVARQLRSRVAWGEEPKPGLVVVSVDNVELCATIMAALAVSVAEGGKRVFVADLSGTGKLASKLGIVDPGTGRSPFSEEAGASIRVYRPRAGTYPPGGRDLPGGGGAFPAEDDAQYLAWVRADVVLTLATLSPALGAEHLKSWASRAVTIVSAGQSTAEELRSIGEMVRLAGLDLDRAVVTRTDRTDVTLGTFTSTHSASMASE